MDFTSLLQGTVGATLIDGVAKRMGVNSTVARTAIAVGIPLMVAALKKNASKPEGANGILGAVNDKHDGGILDNIAGLFSGNQAESEGSKILGHIFGNNQDSAKEAVSQQSGLDISKAGPLLAILAPVVMGMVGKQAKSNNASADGLTGLLGGLLSGGNASQETSAFGSILDKFLDDDDETGVNDLKDVGSQFLKGLFK